MTAGVEEMPLPKFRADEIALKFFKFFLRWLWLVSSTAESILHPFKEFIFVYYFFYKHRTKSNNSFSRYRFRHEPLLYVDNAVYYFKYKNIHEAYVLFVIFLASLRAAGATYNAVFLRDLFYGKIWIPYECVVVAKLLYTRLGVPAKSKRAVIVEITNEIFSMELDNCCCYMSDENL
jgi:hypothetical protein